MPFGIDFVTYSNEDIGFIAAFAAGSDVYQYPLPYPSSMNIWRETMMLFAMEFLFIAPMHLTTGLAIEGISVYLSMLGDDFGVNWGGVGADAEDETLKAQFAGPMWFGRALTTIVATAAVEGSQRRQDTTQNIMYYPPEPLDLVTPLYVNYTNQSATVTLATNASVLDDDSNPTDLTAVRVWFLKRDYTPMEQAFLSRLPTRFQQLDS